MMKRFLAALICITLMPFSAAVQANETNDIPQPDIPAEEIHNTGYVPPDNYAREGAAPDVPSFFSDEDIPTSYQLDDEYIPAVKDQGETNNCWAFSAADALTSNMYKQGLLDKSSNQALSVAKLSWYTLSNTKKDEDGNVIAEGEICDIPTTMGANYEKAVGTFICGISDYESNVPFTSYSYGKNSMIGSGGESVSVATVDSMHRYSNKDDNFAALVKQSIMNNGAMGLMYYNNNSYFNNSTNAYFCGKGTNPSHAVLLVGWDDDYSVENFNESNRPNSNGAWIAKNSWSAGWGKKGYFYISYEETSLYAYSFIADKDIYDRVYSHSAQGYNGDYIDVEKSDTKSIAKGGALNTYTAKEDCQIKKISFFTANNNLDCTVKIYNNVASGQAVSDEVTTLATEMFAVNGLNSVTLNTPVDIAAGERFSVELDFSLADETLNICVEQDANSNDDYISNQGESYLVSIDQSNDDAKTYTDTYNATFNSKTGFHNFPIYVSTDNVSDEADIAAYQEKLNTLLERCEAVDLSDYSNFTAERLTDVVAANEGYALSNDLRELQNAYGRINEAYLGLDTPITITSAEELSAAAAKFNNNESVKTQIELQNDITLADSESPVFLYLYGIEFNGNSHNVSFDGNACGGFIDTAEDADIKDLNIEGNFTSSGIYIGGIANCALFDTTIDNCSFKGSVTASARSYAGGIVGGTYGFDDMCGATITKCTNRANITGTDSYMGGGVVGVAFIYNSAIATCEYGAKTEKCVNFGNINGFNYAAGILGYAASGNSASIKDCGNNGLIEDNTYSDAIVASSSIGYSGCYNFSNTAADLSQSTPSYDLTNASKEDFLNGKVAYLLNTKSGSNSGLWALVDGETVIADDTHGGVSAVNVNIDNKNAFAAYANYKDNVSLTPSVTWIYNGNEVTELAARDNLDDVTICGIVNTEGDVNSDKKADKTDAAAVLKHISDISSLDLISLALADVNNSNSVDLTDVISILNITQNS